MKQFFKIFILIGFPLGVIIGLSRSPVIGSVISVLLGLLYPILLIVQKRKTDQPVASESEKSETSEPNDTISHESIKHMLESKALILTPSSRDKSAVSIGAVIWGILLGGCLGIYVRISYPFVKKEKGTSKTTEVCFFKADMSSPAIVLVQDSHGPTKTWLKKETRAPLKSDSVKPQSTTPTQNPTNRGTFGFIGKWVVDKNICDDVMDLSPEEIREHIRTDQKFKSLKHISDSIADDILFKETLLHLCGTK